MLANFSVDMFYLSYDSALQDDECNGGEGAQSAYVCVFMPNSSWSTGRNDLGRAVFRRDGASYKYWVFMDNDAKELRCMHCEVSNRPASCCLDVYVRYLLLGTVQHAIVGLGTWQTPPHPVEAHTRQLPNGTLLRVPRTKYSGPAYSQLFWDCIDARINAFHADAVPLFLPYFTQLDAVSWWESQALQFYFTLGCVQGSTIILGGFGSGKTEHKEYPRGRVPTAQEQAVLMQEVPTLYPILPVPRQRSIGWDQGNCGNLTVNGWQPLDYVYGHRHDSGWWRDTVRFQLCLDTMRDRFLGFMSTTSPYLGDVRFVQER